MTQAIENELSEVSRALVAGVTPIIERVAEQGGKTTLRDYADAAAAVRPLAAEKLGPELMAIFNDAMSKGMLAAMDEARQKGLLMIDGDASPAPSASEGKGEADSRETGEGA